MASLVDDLEGACRDNAEVRANADGGIGRGVDLGAGEEGDSVLEVKHLAVELVGVDKDEVNDEKKIKFVVVANVEEKGR